MAASPDSGRAPRRSTPIAPQLAYPARSSGRDRCDRQPRRDSPLALRAPFGLRQAPRPAPAEGLGAQPPPPPRIAVEPVPPRREAELACKAAHRSWSCQYARRQHRVSDVTGVRHDTGPSGPRQGDGTRVFGRRPGAGRLGALPTGDPVGRKRHSARFRLEFVCEG